MKLSAGAKFRQAGKDNDPLQIVGTVNPYCAMMAKNLGHQAIYLFGEASPMRLYGLPDLGITTLKSMCYGCWTYYQCVICPCWWTSTRFCGVFQYCTNDSKGDGESRRSGTTWKTKSLWNAVVIDQTKRLLVSKRWSIESKRVTDARTDESLWLWLVRMHWWLKE